MKSCCFDNTNPSGFLRSVYFMLQSKGSAGILALFFPRLQTIKRKSIM